MNVSRYRITLDIHDAASQACIVIKKGDTGRRIYAALTENGMPFPIDPACTVKFTAAGPDGICHMSDDCTVSGSVIAYSLAAADTAATGRQECEFKIYQGNTLLLTTPLFILDVDDTVCD